MMQKVQRFGGAMFTPVLLFAFAGICVGFGTLFTTEAVMGSLAAPTSFWYQCWNVILQGGWTVFNQTPLLFVIGLPIGLATTQNARACMEALISYLTFNYFISTILSQWGDTFGVDFAAEVGGSSGLTNIAGIKTLDMGMMGALIISGIVITIHNRFFEKVLPPYVKTFQGSPFVVIISFFILIPVALLCCLVWPRFQELILQFQSFMSGSGVFGVWIFIFLERILIPTGLHHFVYTPFFYDSGIVPGGLYAYWAQKLPELAASNQSLKELVPEAGFTMTGMGKIFGCVGIALAIYSTARKEKKKEVLGLLIPITLTAVMCGVTEPLEFTFLFIAPPLFLIHALLSATMAAIMYLCGVVGIFSGGVIEMASFNWIPLMSSHWSTYLIQLAIGILFIGIYFVVFRFMILKFNYKTPGREDEGTDIKFMSKKDYKEAKASGSKEKVEILDDVNVDRSNLTYEERILIGLGGKENIVDVTNCATRLRVTVKDGELVHPDTYFKGIGAHGLVHKGSAVQVIVGLDVPLVREKFEKLL